MVANYKVDRCLSRPENCKRDIERLIVAVNEITCVNNEFELMLIEYPDAVLQPGGRSAVVAISPLIRVSILYIRDNTEGKHRGFNILRQAGHP
jgi:hypothetical protein